MKREGYAGPGRKKKRWASLYSQTHNTKKKLGTDEYNKEKRIISNLKMNKKNTKFANSKFKKEKRAFIRHILIGSKVNIE